MATMPPAIRISGLSKSFRKIIGGVEVQALSGITFEVSRGEIFGLLGPNGAGKTTLIKILLGSLYPDSGTAFINGDNIGRWTSRKKTGFLPENHRFPSYLTGMQLLYYYGGLAGLSRSEIGSKAEDLLKLVDMTQWRNTKIKKYSKGMTQRLGIAQVLLNDPELIFLDEPTDGVDPIGRRDIRNILLDLKKKGKTIFLNSHLLSEVEAVCDRVAILDKGRLIRIGPVTGLTGGKPSYQIIVGELAQEIVEKIRSVHSEARFDGNRIEVTLDEVQQINALIDILRQNGVEVVSVTPIKMSLEDSFMQIIKGEPPHE
jgi:ABC-2 type transport system ATP-binding protein